MPPPTPPLGQSYINSLGCSSAFRHLSPLPWVTLMIHYVHALAYKHHTYFILFNYLPLETSISFWGKLKRSSNFHACCCWLPNLSLYMLQDEDYYVALWRCRTLQDNSISTTWIHLAHIDSAAFDILRQSRIEFTAKYLSWQDVEACPCAEWNSKRCSASCTTRFIRKNQDHEGTKEDTKGCKRHTS